MRDFNEVVVFLSIICPGNFTSVRKNVIYPGLLSKSVMIFFYDNDYFIFCL